MALFVALAADGNDVLGTLVAFPLVREVVNVEAEADATILAEPLGTVARNLAARLPSWAAQVLAVFVLALFPCFAPSRTGPRLEVPIDRR